MATRYSPRPPLLRSKWRYKKDPGYDLLKDFTGIGIMARAPYLMLMAASQPDRTVADFVKRAKASPGKLTYASAGNGTVPHFVGERFLRQAGGIKVLHVPYKGNGPAMVDIVSARVDMIFGGYGGVVPVDSKRGNCERSASRSPARMPAPA